MDLVQVTRLALVFVRTWRSGKQRREVPVAEPPPFDYVCYYAYFAYSAAVALTFGVLQPLVLVVASLLFWIESVAKTYMILYMFETKRESGGMLWVPSFGFLMWSLALCNAVVALLVGSQGASDQNLWMLSAILPLFGLVAAFHRHCCKDAHTSMKYCLAAHKWPVTNPDELSMTFGHPMLFADLGTEEPFV